MTDKFPIIHVPPDALESFEEMGTKEKFWFRHQDLGRCLYKKARQNTGEDWAEKIAAELWELLGLPHANYELATFNGDALRQAATHLRGIISPSFVPKDGNLITGNEILARILPSYPKDSKNPSQHTIDVLFSAMVDPTINLPKSDIRVLEFAGIKAFSPVVWSQCGKFEISLHQALPLLMITTNC